MRHHAQTRGSRSLGANGPRHRDVRRPRGRASTVKAAALYVFYRELLPGARRNVYQYGAGLILGAAATRTRIGRRKRDHKRLVLCNERYKELFPKLRELTEPGASFPGLLDAEAEWQRIELPATRSERHPLDTGGNTWHGGSAFEVRTPDGRWIEARVYHAPDVGRICIRIDITARKESEQALHESEERLRTIYQSADDGIFIVDPAKDEIIEVNPGALRLLEYAAEEIKHVPISKVHPNEMGRLQALAQEVAEKGFSRTTQLSCMSK